MARYTGPSYKKARRVGFSISETGKELARRPYGPGQHGNARKGKLSDYGVQLKEKQKGRNKDISSKDMEVFNEEKNKLRENIDELKNEVKNLEDTKNDISNEVDNLSSEKESITQEIDKKKSLNRKVILKDKATLLKENEELREQLSYEKIQHYLYENWYNDLKR